MNHEVITSVHNPQIKRLQQLLERKGREAYGSYLVEGVHLVEEALLSHADVVTIVYDVDRGLEPACERALIQSHDRRIKLVAASSAVLSKLSETKSPQGIVAEVKKQPYDWDDWLAQKQQDDFLLLALDELQDPGNLGTILRTAEAAGVDAVILGKGSVDLYNGKVIRATMGAVFRLPVFAVELGDAADRLKQLGARFLVTSLNEGSVAYDQANYKGKVAIVIGNEARGVSSEAMAKASEFVHIPLYGKAESLNAAVAAGIIVYEARRQRQACRV